MGRWRVGSKVKLNVYEDDKPMFQCHSEEDAARIVDLLNGISPPPKDAAKGGCASDWNPKTEAKRIRQRFLPWDEYPHIAEPGGIADQIEAAIADALAAGREQSATIDEKLVDANIKANDLLKRADEVLDRRWAANWDQRYGKGITIEYARAVSTDVTEIRKAIRTYLEDLGK